MKFKIKKPVSRKFPVIRIGSRKYMDHQTRYDKWAESRQSPACLMEMRLGKTLPNIRIVKKWVAKSKTVSKRKGLSDRSYPILVVAPVSVLETWERELRLEGQRYIVVHGKTFDKRVEITVKEAFGQTGTTWILINYESLRCTPGLANLPWFCVILDESPIVKNPQAKISELCTKGFKEVDHKIILTGLPAPEGELDLYQQFKFLHGHFMGYSNYWEYRNALFELKWNEWRPRTRKPCNNSKCSLVNDMGVREHVVNTDCNWCEGKGYVLFPVAEMIKNYVHENAFVLTRKQAGIGSIKVVEPRYVTMTKDQRNAYDRVETEYISTVGEEGFEIDLETDFSIVQRTWLSRLAGGCNSEGVYKWAPKVTELVSLLKGELSNQPVIVGFKFNAEIDATSYSLKKAGISHTTLTGEDSRDERKRKQEWFRTSGTNSRVILVQIKKVAQYGVDMSVSSTMVLYSVTDSCNEMSQFLDRIVHPEKKEPLLYVYLLAKDTIDEDIYDIVIDGKVFNSKQFMRQIRLNFLERTNRKKGRNK